jgi:hypothetical protein
VPEPDDLPQLREQPPELVEERVDDRALASYLRIEERELGAGRLN